jgi:cysteinyl-tRNA synthetase
LEGNRGRSTAELGAEFPKLQEPMTIRFHNTLTNQLETFVPLQEGKVRMYNCGPTVYSSPHIGNFRSFLFADLLRRYFDWQGFEVTQIMNLTDVGHLRDDEIEAGEDKMELAARRERRTAWQIADHYIEEFFAATGFLHLRPAHQYPRATDHIEGMKEMIQRLMDQGFAYRAGPGNIYFDVGKFEAYGSLSGNTAEELLAGARVKVNPEKRDPRDFALWKIDPHHQMQWDAPWGRGFPGWHIECSAMSRQYLGETLDIHTGGEDNVFPHHECEIAQSECANGQPFVRYWMHARHLLVDGKKMAKRDGTFFTVDDLRERGFSGEALRLALTRVHYREPLNFTMAVLEESQRKVKRYRDLFERLQEAAGPDGSAEEADAICEQARGKFSAALADDLNISVALAALDEIVSEVNRREPAGAVAQRFLDELRDFWSVLGLLEESGTSLADDPAIQELIEQRALARTERDFARADEIREKLRALGVEVKDTKAGPKVIPLQEGRKETPR